MLSKAKHLAIFHSPASKGDSIRMLRMTCTVYQGNHHVYSFATLLFLCSPDASAQLRKVRSVPPAQALEACTSTPPRTGVTFLRRVWT